MTGEMVVIDPVSGIDSDGNEWYFHSAVAIALNGKIMPFDVYQGPYVVIGDNITTKQSPYKIPIQNLGITKLWLISDDEFPELLCRWYNEANDKLSSAFPDGNTPERKKMAVEAARDVI